jgi:hypothetical protein
MMRRAFSYRLVAAVALCGSVAYASEIGQQIADQVDVSNYQHYLDDELYTHDGNNRGVGGPDHDPARDNIVLQLQTFGLQVELEDFWAAGEHGYSVVGTQVGTVYPDAQYIVGGHYDSVSNPGADDDASGVAAILEIARVLSQYETEYTVKYIAFDMEEWGLLGSSAYVDDHLGDDIRGMVQLDMIAWNGAGNACDIYGRSASGPLKNAVAAAIDEYGNGLAAGIYGQFDASDHAPFEWAGYQACLLIEAEYSSNPCYHHQCDSVDTPDYIDYDYAANFTRSIAGFLADYAVVIVGPCEGDLDGDGDVDLGDLTILLSNYGTPNGATYEDGDLDGDGDVDLNDLASLLAVYGTTC